MIKLNVQTNQEAFDTVVRHLKAQGRQAQWDGACLYRTDNGLKCAAGCLIPDEDYSPAIEGNTFRDLVKAGTIDSGAISPALVQQLQNVHDNSHSWSNTFKAAWLSNDAIKELREIAWSFDLDDKVVDETFRYVTGNEIDGLRK